MTDTKPTLRGEASRTTKKSAKDSTLEDLHLYRVNKNSFTIFVGGDPLATSEDGGETGVEYRMADRFEMNLNFLASLDPDRPILVNMATNGGYWEEGIQMFSAILMSPNPITVLATKHARSMSSVIPLAADRFIMRPPTKFMIHRGSFQFAGLDQEAETEDGERRRCNELMLRLYTARLREQGAHKRFSEARIREMLQRKFEKNIDVWLTSDEATHMGFSDGVFDGDLKKLRVLRKDLDRRARMLDILRRPIKVDVSVS